MKFLKKEFNIKEKMIMMTFIIISFNVVQIIGSYDLTNNISNKIISLEKNELYLQKNARDLQKLIYSIKDETFNAISEKLTENKVELYKSRIISIENKIKNIFHNDKNFFDMLEDKSLSEDLAKISKQIIILSSSSSNLISLYLNKNSNFNKKAKNFNEFNKLANNTTYLMNKVFDKINLDLSNKIHNLEREASEKSFNFIVISLIAIFILIIVNILLATSISGPIKKLLHELIALERVFDGLMNSANKQAVSLEETAASIEEITGNIRGNTEKATVMAELANESKDTAIQGDHLLKENSMAMEAIDESTKKIEEAISQIEQIAFQTNILSLNAAVEAATAGEHGKGFAVVANEVRNLASMSAEVAKEIKQLSVEATNKTNLGKEVSNQISKSFSELIEKISETANIVEDVSEANKEQLIGMEQINQSSTGLDTLTQENTVLVNEAKDISYKVTDLAVKIIGEDIKRD